MRGRPDVEPAALARARLRAPPAYSTGCPLAVSPTSMLPRVALE